jgi:D-glycero-D-manno-heptose 1,7-bisphosphate phosphatase
VTAGLRPAVFLDRDGTLNRAYVREGVSYPPGSLDELEILPGVPEALAKLSAAGFALVVITNQPDVARRTVARAVVEQLNDALRQRLPIDDVRCCYHDDADGCACRKPAPGMIVDAAKQAGLQLTSSFVVGDRWRDIEAGKRAGCRTILLQTTYNENDAIEPDFEAANMSEAADYILRWRGSQSR